MNTILDDEQREKYKADIDELFTLCPDMMNRKYLRANVQQGFVFNKVKELSTLSSDILCVGSHEDTACEGLKKTGYNVTAIDPVVNMDLDTFYKKSDGKKYDIVFSTSVIEHVPQDEPFIDQICKLLNPNGYAVLTCDFNNDYGKKAEAPVGDFRLYTKNDLLVRFDKILKENGCEMFGEINYESPPDFNFGGCIYSFATYVFTKL